MRHYRAVEGEGMRRRVGVISSIAILVSVVLLMIRSRTWIDCVEFGTDRSYTFVCSDVGRFIVGSAEGPWDAERGVGLRSIHRDRPHAHQPWRFVHPAMVARRINADAGQGPPSIHSVHGGWLAAACSLPIVEAWLRVSQPRSPSGCLACGYNLTGNTSGVCPECGMPATASGALLSSH